MMGWNSMGNAHVKVTRELAHEDSGEGRNFAYPRIRQVTAS